MTSCSIKMFASYWGGKIEKKSAKKVAFEPSSTFRLILWLRRSGQSEAKQSRRAYHTTHLVS